MINVSVPVYEKGDLLKVNKKMEIVPAFLIATPEDKFKITFATNYLSYEVEVFCAKENKWLNGKYWIQLKINEDRVCHIHELPKSV